MTVTTLTSHRKTPPHGTVGGAAGATGENSVLRLDGTIEAMNGNDVAQMNAGDVYVLKSPGGGGYGAPRECSMRHTARSPKTETSNWGGTKTAQA